MCRHSSTHITLLLCIYMYYIIQFWIDSVNTHWRTVCQSITQDESHTTPVLLICADTASTITGLLHRVCTHNYSTSSVWTVNDNTHGRSTLQTVSVTEYHQSTIYLYGLHIWAILIVFLCMNNFIVRLYSVMSAFSCDLYVISRMFKSFNNLI